MLPNDLKRLLLKNRLPHLLIFTGPESYVKKDYLNHISNNFISIDNLENILQVSNSSSLFNDVEYYKLCDLDILKKENLWSKLKSTFISSNNYCVILIDNIEVKSKFHKDFEDYIVYFDYLSRDLIYRHLKDLSKLNDKNFWDLVNICECDYSHLLIEINKIENYAVGNNVSNDIAYDILLKGNVIERPINDIVFDFVNAIVYGNTSGVNRLYNDIKKTDEHYLTILSLLYKQFMSVYLIMSCKGDAQLENSLGMTPQQIYAIKKNLIGGYSLQEVERNLRCIQYCESKSKTGELDSEKVLDYCISNLMR